MIMSATLDMIFKVMAIIGIGASAVTFIGSKTEAVKFDPTPIVQRISTTETMNAVQDTKIETLKSDISEMKADIKTILKAVRPTDYRPAVPEVTKNEQ